MSDLHLERAPFEPRLTDADVIILAGDVGEGISGIEWAKGAFDAPVLYVPGNHEFHDDFYTMEQHSYIMNEAASGSNVTLLDNDVTFVDDVRFIGTTLWSDLSNVGSVLYCDADSILVEHTPGEAPAYFNLSDAQALFDQNKAWLQSELAKRHDGKTVVITHHAPSKKSMHEKYNGNAWNDCFFSSMEELMGGVDIWVHGHTHSNCDYMINNTRVICNPKGYPTLTDWENPDFDLACLVYL